MHAALAVLLAIGPANYCHQGDSGCGASSDWRVCIAVGVLLVGLHLAGMYFGFRTAKTPRLRRLFQILTPIGVVLIIALMTFTAIYGDSVN